MTDFIRTLDRIGADPALRHANPAALAALLAADADPAEAIGGVLASAGPGIAESDTGKLYCIVFPVDPDEPKREDEPEREDEPAESEPPARAS